MALFKRKKKSPVERLDSGDAVLQPVQTSQQAYAPRAGDLTVGDYANGMPNIRLSEVFKSFIGQLPWLAVLLIAGVALAYHLTKDFKRTYTGDGRILVQLGDEYVYQPVTGQAGQAGLTLTPDTIVLNEVGIIKNSEILDQVIGEMTATQADKVRFDKEAFQKIASARNEFDKREAYMKLRSKVDRSFLVAPRPKSSVVDLAYKHEDGDVAVETLNAFIDAYMSYRRTIFVEGAGDIISERRIATENQLNQNERAIARFMKKNNVSDFGSEQGGVRKRTEELRAALNLLRAQMAETETALATVENQLRGTNQTIDLYVDDRASQRVAQAELELKQLQAKYLSTSDPVRQKQTELAELKSLQSSYGGRAAGGRRVGPNPVFQALQTRRNTLQATADSYREKEFTLQRQLDSADSKVRRLASLSPEYQNLLRERDTLSKRLDTYNSKEQEALVNQQQAEANSENIKVISYAKYPNKGRNTQAFAWLGASLAWGLTLFMLALLRVFLDPKLYAAPMPRRESMISDMHVNIPEPVMPVDEPYRPAAANYATEPQQQSYEPVAYDPGYAQQGYAPVATGTTDVYAQQGYIQDPYAGQTTAHYDPNSYTQPQHDPNAYAQATTDPVAYSDGSAAVDMYQNPYLSGQTAAGSIDQPPQGYVDPNNPYLQS